MRWLLCLQLKLGGGLIKIIKCNFLKLYVRVLYRPANCTSTKRDGRSDLKIYQILDMLKVTQLVTNNVNELNVGHYPMILDYQLKTVNIFIYIFSLPFCALRACYEKKYV